MWANIKKIAYRVYKMLIYSTHITEGCKNGGKLKEFQLSHVLLRNWATFIFMVLGLIIKARSLIDEQVGLPGIVRGKKRFAILGYH